MAKKKKHQAYAYEFDGERGIVDTWAECERLVKGRNARYRGFADRAAAEAWLAAGARYEDRTAEKQAAIYELPQDAIFFDAGTGGGHGTEVKVVDREAVPVVHLVSHEVEGELTKEGNLLLGRGRSNNYGELLGCLLAMRAADALSCKHVYGDSRLVLDYWSRGHVSKSKRDADPDLVQLAQETARQRRRFEAGGGRLDHVPGGINPADLGYHRD